MYLTYESAEHARQDKIDPSAHRVVRRAYVGYIDGKITDHYFTVCSAAEIERDRQEAAYYASLPR